MLMQKGILHALPILSVRKRLGKVHFLLEGGGPGLRRGGFLVFVLTCFIFNRGKVSVFSGKEKMTPCHFYFVYKSKATSQD